MLVTDGIVDLTPERIRLASARETRIRRVASAQETLRRTINAVPVSGRSRRHCGSIAIAQQNLVEVAYQNLVERRTQVCDAIQAIEELQRWRHETQKPKQEILVATTKRLAEVNGAIKALEKLQAPEKLQRKTEKPKHGHWAFSELRKEKRP